MEEERLALTLPILLTLIMGIISFRRMVYAYTTVSSAGGGYDHCYAACSSPRRNS
jgi:hypothetical protein